MQLNLTVSTFSDYFGKHYALEGRESMSGKPIFKYTVFNLEESCDGYWKVYAIKGKAQLNQSILKGYAYCESFDCFDCFDHNSMIYFNSYNGPNGDKALCEAFKNGVLSGKTGFVAEARKVDFKTTKYYTGPTCAKYKEDALEITQIR